MFSWCLQDPLEAARTLHATMRAHDFAADTSARIAHRTFRTLDTRIANAPSTRMRSILMQDKRELDAKEVVCTNTSRLLHKMYHSADITLVTLQATLAAQALSNVCVDVRSSDGNVLKNSIAVARQLERADQLLDAIDTITSKEDVDDDNDEADNLALISSAPLPPTGPRR